MPEEKKSEFKPVESGGFVSKEVIEDQTEAEIAAYEEEIERENKEKLKLPPILLIYRDNDLFQEKIPEMQSVWQSIGRTVEIQSFPRDTEKDAIIKWYEENKDKLKDKEMITDDTAAIPSKMIKNLAEKGIIKTFKEKNIISGGFIEKPVILKIDAIISKILKEATDKFIFSDNIDKLKQNNFSLKSKQIEFQEGEKFPVELAEESSKIFYSTIIKRILENPANIPDKVYIFLDRILDHTYFNDAQIIEAQDHGDITSKKERIMAAKQKAAEKFKQWFEEGGLQSDKIIIQPGIISGRQDVGITNEGKMLLAEIDKENSWFIQDRHAGSFGRIGGFVPDGAYLVKCAKYLKLPESDFFNDVISQKLIDISPEEIKQKFNEILKENFKKPIDAKDPLYREYNSIW